MSPSPLANGVVVVANKFYMKIFIFIFIFFVKKGRKKREKSVSSRIELDVVRGRVECWY